MADDVKVTISIDDNPAKQAFIRLNQSIDNFSSNFLKGIGVSKGAFDVFQGAVAANVAVAGFKAITGAAGALFDMVAVQGVTSAIEFEEKLQELNVALVNSGQFSNKLSKDLQDLAQATQETTKFSDSMVISAATQLQTLARLSGDGLQRATKDSIDLAAALRIDLTTAAELVAKAHEGQTSALRRQGIVISESLSPAEKYTAVLEQIEKRFGGTAQAQANTYSARIEILKNQYDDAVKGMGFFITKNEGVVATLKVATDVLKDFTTQLTGGKTASQELTQMMIYMATAIAPLAQLADGIGRVFTAAFRVAAVVIDSFAVVVNRVFQSILGGVQLTYNALAVVMPEAFEKSAQKVAKFSTDFAAQTNLLSASVTTNVQKIGTAFTEDTALEKFAERAKKAAIQIQEEVAKMSARPKQEDQKPAKQDDSEAQKQYLVELANSEAEITKIQMNAEAERQAADAQFRIAIGEGRTQDLIDLQNFELQKAAIVLSTELDKANQITNAAKREQAIRKANADYELAQVKLQNKAKSDLRKQELADQDTFLSTAATLSNAKNKELAAIGKAASITQIAIKTPPAIASSFEFGTKLGGPPLGFTFGAIAAAAMAAQASAIAGVKFETGGIVPGLNQYGDQVQARLNPGEVVLNKTQQKELLDVANGRANNASSDKLSALVDAIKNQVISINVDGRELARVIRDQKAAGFAI